MERTKIHVGGKTTIPVYIRKWLMSKHKDTEYIDFEVAWEINGDKVEVEFVPIIGSQKQDEEEEEE